jgi:beta-lactamase class A
LQCPSSGRNAELESRIRAVLVKSNGVFGVSVRHIRSAEQQFLRECRDCTTPAEMTMLFEKLVTGQAAGADASEQMLRLLSEQNFNQRLPRWIPGSTRFAHKTGTLNSPVWVVNDAGVMFLPGGQHAVVSVFSRRSNMEEDPLTRKTGIGNAEDRIAEIGKVVWEYYSRL